MNKSVISIKVLKLMHEQLGVPVGEIKLDSTIEELGIDSLDEIEIVMAVEDAFDLEIPDEDCEKWETVQSIIDYTFNHSL